MFKYMLTAAALSVVLVSGTATAQDMPRWGTMDEVMGYNGSLSPIPKGQTQRLHPNADFYANKMWCRDEKVRTTQTIDREMAKLFNSSVEFDARGTTQYHQVSDFLMQIRLWNTQHVQPRWEQLMADPQLRWQSCQQYSKEVLVKFNGAVKIFREGNDNYRR